jgi:hypothetical protein
MRNLASIKKISDLASKREKSSNYHMDSQVLSSINKNFNRSNIVFDNLAIKSVWYDHNERINPYFVITTKNHAWKIPASINLYPYLDMKICVASFDESSYEYKSGYSHYLIFFDEMGNQIKRLLSTQSGRILSINPETANLMHAIN